jgi:hypothetical protein
MTLDEMIGSVVAGARLTLLRQAADDVMTPLLFGFAADKQFLLPMPWRDDGEKARYLDFARFALKQHDALGYVIVSEGWAAGYPANIGFNPDVLPRNRLDRVEVLAVYAELGGATTARYWRIVRGEDGTVADITDLGDIQNAQAPGFAGLLDRRVH